MSAALILTAEGYGNLIMATPLMAAVASLGYETHVLVESNWPHAAELLCGWPALYGVHTTRDEVTVRNWDIVVTTVWARSVAGLRTERVVWPDRCDLRRTHESEANMTAARKLGYAGETPPAHCEYSEPAPNVPGERIILCPGFGGRTRTDWGRKAWPHWNELAASLSTPILILGAQDDLEPWMNDKPRLLGAPIRRVAGILARARGVIACDNGLAHIAAALDAPTIALFGATSEIKNRPLGAHVRIIAAPLDCRPCQMTDRWHACADWQCMADITPEAVLEAIP